MGLSDRDYMRNRARDSDRPRPFTPPSTGMGLPWIILIWVSAAYILFKLYSAYFPVKKPHRGPTAQVQPQDVERSEIQSEQVRPRALPRHVSPAETRVAESPAPPPRREVRDTASASNTIYLCRAYSGGTFWAEAHCNQHNALIERIAYVPPSLPFDQKVSIASEQQRQGAATLQSQVTRTQESESPAASQQAQCRSLDARVVQLDAMARQPQSAQMQDWIAGQRKQARDSQFRLRC
jgi:hypothetical protein